MQSDAVRCSKWNWSFFQVWPPGKYVWCWKGTFERMISTFWVLCPDFLSHYCLASSCNHCYPWILRVWLRCSVISAPVPLPKRVCVKSDSRISSQGWWVSWVVLHNLWPQAVAENLLLSSPKNVHSNETCAVIDWWVLLDIGEEWCEEWLQHPSHQWPNRT
jgi:hypothetical protein